MLKKIKLDNYVTFIKPTEISFASTNYKFLEDENVGNNKILKGCLFVGENASGKTKILKSITFLLDLLFKNSEIDFTTNKSFYTNKETYKLEYTFSFEKEIVYSLEIGLNNIIAEKLLLDNETILERIGNSAKFTLGEEEKYFDNLSNDLSFLRRIYFDTKFYGNEILNKWFDYMKNSVYINCYYRTVNTYCDKNLLVHDYLNKNTVIKINEFLNKINYKQQIKYKNKKYISFNKDNTDVYIPEIFESTGNKTFIELIPSFLHAIENECMIIIDEFSSGFHNELEECIIKYFFHYSKNSQVFFTTHSTNVLNNSLLRPDQIYSVSFNGKKGSVLKRFSSENPRESQNTEKMYLNGVFDGMPRYNKIFKD